MTEDEAFEDLQRRRPDIMRDMKDKAGELPNPPPKPRIKEPAPCT